MTLLPKDPPIINKALLRAMKLVIDRCEWPDGCSAQGTDVAHIRARGMGGGRRKDVLENLVVLCRPHHGLYDHVMGQSPKNQRYMKLAVEKRDQETIDEILKRC